MQRDSCYPQQQKGTATIEHWHGRRRGGGARPTLPGRARACPPWGGAGAPKPCGNVRQGATRGVRSPLDPRTNIAELKYLSSSCQRLHCPGMITLILELTAEQRKKKSQTAHTQRQTVPLTHQYRLIATSVPLYPETPNIP